MNATLKLRRYVSVVVAREGIFVYVEWTPGRTLDYVFSSWLGAVRYLAKFDADPVFDFRIVSIRQGDRPRASRARGEVRSLDSLQARRLRSAGRSDREGVSWLRRRNYVTRQVVCPCGSRDYFKGHDFKFGSDNRLLPSKPVWKCTNCNVETPRQIRNNPSASLPRTTGRSR